MEDLKERHKLYKSAQGICRTEEWQFLKRYLRSYSEALKEKAIRAESIEELRSLQGEYKAIQKILSMEVKHGDDDKS